MKPCRHISGLLFPARGAAGTHREKTTNSYTASVAAATIAKPSVAPIIGSVLSMNVGVGMMMVAGTGNGQANPHGIENGVSLIPALNFGLGVFVLLACSHHQTAMANGV